MRELYEKGFIRASVFAGFCSQSASGRVFGTPVITIDFDNDGNTNSSDYAEFRQRFGVMI